tara:strand:- start:480 stop:1031 length:552 start_codon:yes stop_codon:yes gene_type:complete
MKILLTDIDGVILDWSGHFNKYLKTYYPDLGLMNPTEFDQTSDIAKVMHRFNTSAWLGWLQPLRDAQEILPKFKEAGYDIICCTAMGDDPYSQALRKVNLENVFPNMISRMDTTGFGVPKAEWLSQWKGSGAVWVEDKWVNARAGADIGLETYLMKQSYNSMHDYKGVEKVDNWTQIYSKVVK